METKNNLGAKLNAEIIEIKGHCNAGHKMGDKFELSYHDTCGLCGIFYHNILPAVSTYQFGGQYPWFKGNLFFVKCPDPQNQVTMKVLREE